MGKTIRYDSEHAKHAPRRFVISYFNEHAGVWMETRAQYRQAKAETTLQRMRADGVVARMEVSR